MAGVPKCLDLEKENPVSGRLLERVTGEVWEFRI